MPAASYFSRLVPPAADGGIPLLRPPRLLFRPDVAPTETPQRVAPTTRQPAAAARPQWPRSAPAMTPPATVAGRDVTMGGMAPPPRRALRDGGAVTMPDAAPPRWRHAPREGGAVTMPDAAPPRHAPDPLLVRSPVAPAREAAPPVAAKPVLPVVQLPALEALSVLAPAPPRPRPAAPADAPAAGLRIGTLEVRVAAPSAETPPQARLAPSRAPPSAATPARIARSFAAFGLGQS